MPADDPDLLALIASAVRAGSGLSVLSPQACAAALGQDGVSLSLVHELGLDLVWYEPSDTTGIAFEDLQYTLGEGPSIDAARTAQPVTVADMRTVPQSRWPALLATVSQAPVPLAVHAAPLQLGESPLGVLTGHRAAPGTPTRLQKTQFLALAQSLATLVTTPEGIDELLTDTDSLYRSLVHQAEGVLAARLGIPLDRAQDRLRAHAFAHSSPLLDVARAVLGNRGGLDITGD